MLRHCCYPQSVYPYNQNPQEAGAYFQTIGVGRNC